MLRCFCCAGTFATHFSCTPLSHYVAQTYSLTVCLRRRFKAALKATKAGTEPQWEGPAPPSHLQKKITRKVKFLEKVAANQPPKVAGGGVAKKRSKKPKTPLPSLASLAGTLDEMLGAPAAAAGAKRRASAGAAAASGADNSAAAGSRRDPRAGSGVGTARVRTVIQQKESARLKQVLAHPQFIADPFAAVMNHLNATLPPPPERPAAKAGTGAGGDKRKKKRKGKGGGGDMDMED